MLNPETIIKYMFKSSFNNTSYLNAMVKKLQALTHEKRQNNALRDRKSARDKLVLGLRKVFEFKLLISTFLQLQYIHTYNKRRKLFVVMYGYGWINIFPATHYVTHCQQCCQMPFMLFQLLLSRNQGSNVCFMSFFRQVSRS